VRLPVPGPRDVITAVGEGAESLSQLVASVPRVLGLIDSAERAMRAVEELIERIELTRQSAEEVVRRTGSVAVDADALLVTTERLLDRVIPLVDGLQPSLTQLQPVLERLAETTEPHEVDALVELVDHLPALAHRMETDILPVLESLSTVSPDLHDLLSVARELNEVLGRLPGLGRIKRRVDEEQSARDHT
jgi:uncharacterized protein YoxC